MLSSERRLSACLSRQSCRRQACHLHQIRMLLRQGGPCGEANAKGIEQEVDMDGLVPSARLMGRILESGPAPLNQARATRIRSHGICFLQRPVQRRTEYLGEGEADVQAEERATGVAVKPAPQSSHRATSRWLSGTQSAAAARQQ